MNDSDYAAWRKKMLTALTAVWTLALVVIINPWTLNPDWQGWVALAVAVPLLIAAPACVIMFLDAVTRYDWESNK